MARVELTESVVRAHQASVWRYLRFLGCDPALADDLTQDAFLALLRAHLPDRGPAALDGWLRGTARNLMRNRRRQIRRELATASPETIEDAWSGYVRDDHGARYRAALRACIAALPERQREVVELRWGRRAKRADIASAVGVSIEGAKSLLRRIKHALKTCILKRIGDESTRA